MKDIPCAVFGGYEYKANASAVFRAFSAEDDLETAKEKIAQDFDWLCDREELRCKKMEYANMVKLNRGWAMDIYADLVANIVVKDMEEDEVCEELDEKMENIESWNGIHLSTWCEGGIENYCRPVTYWVGDHV